MYTLQLVAVLLQSTVGSIWARLPQPMYKLYVFCCAWQKRACHR
jgi:hypothetical protein